MKKTTFTKFLSATILASLLLGSCTTELDWDNLLNDVKIDHSLVIPIGEASTTIEEVLNQLDTIEYIGTEGSSIFVQYSDSVRWDFRKIPLLNGITPIQKEYYPSNGLTMPIPPNTPFTFTINENIDLGINSTPETERIDTIIGKSAKIKILLQKENIDIDASNISYEVIFPSNFLTFKDNSSSHTFHASAFDVDEEFILPEFTMYTDNAAQNIPIIVEITATTGSSTIIITPLSKLSISVKLSELNYKMIYGSFKPKVSLGAEEETVDMGDFQSSIPKGLFRIAEPTLNVTVENYTGVLINAQLDYVKAYRLNETEYEPVYATFKDDSHSTSLTLNPSAEYGIPGISHFTLDNDSGGLDKLFDRELLPNMLDYKYNLTNLPSTHAEFITDDAKIDVKFDLKVPLLLNGGSYVEFNDTIKDVDLNDILDKDYIDNAILVLNITNGIPVGVNFKLQLLQTDFSPVPNVTIDSVFVVDQAVVDANGLVLKDDLKTQTIEIKIKKDQLDQLRSTNHIAYTIRVDRTDNNPIRFELTNSFAIKAGIFVKSNLVVDDLNSNN